MNNLEWCDHKYNINYGTGLTRRAEKRSTAVRHIKSDGLVTSYKSMNEAELITGIKVGNISAVCLGKHKTAGGSRWEKI